MSRFFSYLFFWIRLSEVRSERRVLNSDYVRNDERLKMYAKEVYTLTTKETSQLSEDAADRINELAIEMMALSAIQTNILKKLDGKRLYLI